MRRRVVITGIGPVTAAGIGKKEFFNSILEKKKLSLEIPEEFEKGYSFKSRRYVPLPEVDFNIYPEFKKLKYSTSLGVNIAILSTILALEDAKINDIEKSTSVIMGVGIGSLENTFSAYNAHTSGKKFNRMSISLCMPNSISAWISIAYKLHGASYTINTACASSTNAIGEAYRKIADGYNDVVICGGVECLKDNSGTTMRSFDVLSTLTKDPEGNPKPFTKNRSGFLYSEGAACTLILEEMEHALKRGADIYAEIGGYATNCDGYNIIMMPTDGDKCKEMLMQLIKDEKIDYYNAHGTGTILNDQVEEKVIKEIFGEVNKQPYINSTKGILGHNIGASGAIEAAICAISVKEGIIHCNDLDDPIEGLNLVNDNLHVNVNTAISASFGFGGHNAGLLFRKFNV
ncbi:beta-ketoacyl-[acyl-carrier-protein] synthase family protein [Ruminiclostridium josui]|uniref:beta-ketoacyl-[acyl-carrier-protein] synthase family protein n=1 Tax=Ruminiclostridium josui TaxID=1499 RepID=UPI000465B778|nr:beta-ketoacyl-[acyl-carrier-protein] synthase family protein [Ruminiclostridium josui]